MQYRKILQTSHYRLVSVFRDTFLYGHQQCTSSCGLKDENRKINMLSDENMEETDFRNGRKKTTGTVVQTESHRQKGNLHSPDYHLRNVGDVFN